MSLGATMSIYGAYKFRPKILKNVFTLTAIHTLPEYEEYLYREKIMTEDEYQQLIDYIVMDNAELELVYSDIDYLERAIKLWFDANKMSFRKLYSSMFFKYNPLWNKDGKISETRKHDSTRVGTTEGASESEMHDISASSGNSSNNSDTTNSVAGFDAAALANRDKSVTDDSSTNSTAALSDSRGKNSTSGESTEQLHDSETYERVEQGNIGVTTTPTMIKEFREVEMVNFYDFISKSFRERFCLLIY